MRPLELPVFVLSDATGRTAENVGRAALVQFPGVLPRIRRFAKVTGTEQLAEILDQARRAHALVLYSLVDERLRRELRRLSRELDVVAFDTLGPLIARMRRLLQRDPLGRPGLLAHTEESTLRLGAAIEFTMRHDDGLGLETAGDADLVLLGISRTGKTPTSIYLACNHTMKVVNTPIILGHELPAVIAATRVPRVGLTVSVDRLVALRRARLKDVPHYTEMDAIRREVTYGLRVLRALPHTPVIDVTQLSVEEIADEVLRTSPNGAVPAGTESKGRAGRERGHD